jgi:prefoldin subunit 5
MTPEQKDLFAALKGIELNDRAIYDLENKLRNLDYERAEIQRELDIYKARHPKIERNFEKRLAEQTGGTLNEEQE